MSNYRDRPLLGYLPEVIKNIREYKAVIDAEQPEIFALFEAVIWALDNQFILTSTDYGIGRWEKMLKITPKATETLDERKFAVLARLAEQLPFTYRRLEQMLTALCGKDGYEITLRHNVYELEVKVELAAIANYEAVRQMLKRVAPANLVIITALERPEMQTTVYAAAGMRMVIRETTLPMIKRGDFSAVISPQYGMAKAVSRELPLLPDVSRRAFLRDEATGAVYDIYISDGAGIYRAYLDKGVD